MVAILLLLLSIWVIHQSRSLVYTEEFSPGAGFFPFWLGISLLVLSLVLFVNSAVLQSAETEASPLPGKQALLRILFIVGSLLASIIVFERIGFLLSTFLLVAVLLIHLEDYRWYSGIGLSACMVFAIYALFKLGLKVPLPAGFLR